MTTASLLDHLQDQGYEPQEDDCNYWYDLIVSGIGTVRVNVDAADGHRTDVHLFDRYMCCEWSVTASPGTPGAIILATVEAAEWQLADLRGGPVTPAQAARA